ncbi:hypothetical protein BN7_5130 [Wickerhamomyces ciferrii]|uniref:Phospholipase D1 n=1 Tax=Wickerhamomyces ciferrii (strain ATCC 14091 / BCRC 22168 / CBS 111 / JCM 3599 / NBRC 0793 / NRRL Y-1031 F-60-10) TaxID=1206466 RepID=K0KWQ3_WICCF|nr:uncharacterized protein BN7_5130 [Wickerhamomyces ciferrii]CCH45548.1 hypothetical protein BN7_5130 [Wickerhamomyces ciferrii]
MLESLFGGSNVNQRSENEGVNGTTNGTINGNSKQQKGQGQSQGKEYSGINDENEDYINGTTKNQKNVENVEKENAQGDVFKPEEIPNKFEFTDNDLQERLMENVYQSRDDDSNNQPQKADESLENFDKRPIRMGEAGYNKPNDYIQADEPISSQQIPHSVEGNELSENDTSEILQPSSAPQQGQGQAQAQQYLPSQPSTQDGEMPTQRLGESPTWYKRIPLIGTPSSAPSTPLDDSNRWKDLKQVLRFGKKRDSEVQLPNQQSQAKKHVLDETEEQTRMRASNLITSLISGSPAALFAGASFIQDEHGSRRAPLLLSLLGLTVQDITIPGSNNKKYKINLEYGVGPNRVRWFVVKDLRDLVGLHSRLKVVFFQSLGFRGFKPVELPRFPRAKEDIKETNTFNNTYLSAQLPQNDELPSHNLRQQLQNNLDSQGNGTINGQHVTHGRLDPDAGELPSRSGGRDSVETDDITSINSRTSLRSHLQNLASRISSIGEADGPGVGSDASQHEQYRLKIENYLRQLCLSLSLRPQANRLFQFFELSPLSVLLSYEQGYQGKQGYMIVRSSAKAQGWRVGHLKYSDIKGMVSRHTNKWFLVRNSYIMYTSDIYSTTPLEVFLVDSSFKMTYSGEDEKLQLRGNSGGSGSGRDNNSLYDENNSLKDEAFEEDSDGKLPTHLSIKLENSERSMKILATSRYQLGLWVKSIETMQSNTIWAKPHRFDSFAPVRQDAFAQWFVDARDHFWAVSSAMEMAKDVIYIHDWWLSPELYMRRPANGNQEWRLDRILKRKAEQGVKIFVIVYRNVGTTVVTDSLWTKHSLIDLHPNIHVLRSPNQWLQNTYFWAHHEKLCIIDHTVAFLGGIDLCYGRYDTPDHVLVDDSPHDFATKQNANEESIKYQKFPGKDYSNPRVLDFFELEKPYESMYDRDSVPRMPWHDVHMVTAGQPASDLARHFVQRWNYLLRQKRPSRPTPILTPPSEYSPIDLKRFNLTGNCEVQLLRSSGNWSLGLKKTEHSIQNAYLKLIETSEHYVYLENQFFVTATAFDGTIIENRIGDALVDRIIRAHNEKKKWKAIIMIPLMPGFPGQLDEADGSSVRVIMQCQYMSISRGSTSIFGKLKKMKINPYDYIQFFSLRKWGRIGPNRKIVSEQLYIHAKTMVVDDRVAIIGSANINERSQRGNRDSEIAACVRDTETVNTTMNGKPYKAGRFAHTLRMRLMREHLGIDVDIVEIVERRFSKLEELAKATKTGQDSKTHQFQSKDNEVASAMVELASRDVLNLPNGTQKWQTFKKRAGKPTVPKVDEEFFKNIDKDDGEDKGLPPHLKEKAHEPAPLFYHSFNNRAREENTGIRDKKQFSTDSRVSNTSKHKNDIDGKGQDRMESKEYQVYKLNAAKTLKRWAKESLVNDTTDVFLPNVEQVLEFLENDDFVEDPTKLTDQEEIVLAERNQERWDLLKRIAYLQRVAAKQKTQNDDENDKRYKIGIPTLSNAFARQEKQNGGQSAVDKVPKQKTNQYLEAKQMEKNGNPDSQAQISAEFQEIEELPGDNIPVVALDSKGIREVLDNLGDASNNGESNFNKFIDPYCFGDPIDDAFYEDVWFDNALRNSKIFREVFHCQPDDAVTSWKDYKEFTRLSTAFNLAQDQEVRRREALFKSYSHSDVGENDSEDLKQVRERMQESSSISAQDVTKEDVSESSSDKPQGRRSQNTAIADEDEYSPRGKSGSYGLRSRLMGERVFDRETADRLLSEIQGHLVLFPVDWLYKEVDSGNWFYNMDRLPPIDIYD